MTTIMLLDARRGLNLKCRELFRDEKIADAIYRYLCDGIEECEDAEPKRKRGKWTKENACEFCDFQPWYERDIHTLSFCPNCGADMRGEQNDND